MSRRPDPFDDRTAAGRDGGSLALRDRATRAAAATQRAVETALATRRVTVLLALALVLWFELQLLVYHFASPAAFRWLFTVDSLAPASPGWLLAVVSHATWTHLGVNVAMLLAFGGLAEPHLGRREYLAFFVGAGLPATLGAVALRPANAPVVGASGAVFALLGFALYHEARRHDGRLFPDRDGRGGLLRDERALLRLAVVGLGFPLVVLQLGLGAAGAIPTGDTAVWAHVFGLLGGVLYDYWRPALGVDRCA